MLPPAGSPSAAARAGWRCGDERNDYGRLLARCRLGGEDLSTWLIEQGYGLAFSRYSTKLVAEEEQARAGKRRLWRTVLEQPWEFRARRWAEAGSTAPGGCAIKGNLSRKGERIYHTPFMCWRWMSREEGSWRLIRQWA
jgi:hypothetical protein